MGKKLISLFFLLNIITVSAYSQKVIKGMVRDTAQVALPQANIFVKDTLSQKILVFTQSQKDGSFTLKFDSPADTVWISVTKMGFASQNFKISALSTQLNFVLVTGAFALEEVRVRKPPARRFGDTLSFSVDNFKTDSDRTIGDIIKKLPGIDVDGNGRISYQGVPINRYYIENLNLLDGRYGLVNENLPFGKVTKVEIMENHQPIRVLDSVQVSRSAAINLKLTNKFTKTVPVKMGVGLKPLLWDVKVTPMVFIPNLQFVGSFQSNNAGHRISNQFQTFRSFSETNTRQLSVARLSSPPLIGDSWFDNQSHAGSVNFLRKTKKKTDLKLNTALLLDKELQSGNLAQTYTIGGETIKFKEVTDNTFKKNQAEITLTVEHNLPSNYFKNSLNFTKEWRADEGFNVRPERSYQQNNETGGLGIINDFHRIIKRQSKLYNFYSQSSFNQSSQLLKVELMGIDTVASTQQDFSRSAFKTHNYFNFTKKLGVHYNVSGTIGSEITSNRLQSELEGHRIQSDSVNDLSWSAYKTYLRLSTGFKKNFWNLSFNLPIAHYYISLNDKIYTKNYKTSQLMVEPGVYLYYDKRSLRYSLSFNYSDIVPDPNTGVYPGYIMMNYLDLTRRNPDFSKGHQLMGSTNLSYNDVISGFNYILSYTRSQAVRNRVNLSEIQSDGTDISSFLDLRNVVDNNTVNAKVGQYFYKLKSLGFVGFTYSKNKNQRVLNNVLGDYAYQSISTTASFTYNGLNWMDIGYNFLYSRSDNGVSNRFNTFNHQGFLGFTPVKRVYFRWGVQYYTLDNKDTNNDYLIGDFKLRFTIKKSKRDIELNVNNLFNQKDFKTISAGEYYITQSEYQLRPRQFMINFNFTL